MADSGAGDVAVDRIGGVQFMTLALGNLRYGR